MITAYAQTSGHLRCVSRTFSVLFELKTLVNSLDPDQDQHSVGPEMDPNRLTLCTVFQKYFFEKVNF